MFEKIIAGVAIESNGFRYYPKKDSIAPLLGKTNIENAGVFGIEAEYDQYLAGTMELKKLKTTSQVQISIMKLK